MFLRFVSLLKSSFFLLAFCVFVDHVYSAESDLVIERITITGNQRIQDQAVLSFLPIKLGDEFTEEKSNIALKDLFKTGLFSDISLTLDNKTLKVHVVENSLLNQIAFEGNSKIDTATFLQQIQLYPRAIFTPERLQNALRIMQTLYRAQGYFLTRITPQVIKRDQGRIDLVFQIDEGHLVPVRRIVFVGNQHFNDTQLEAILLTKESRWYRFFMRNDRYEPSRLSYDKERLSSYYKSQGYAEFHLISAVAEFSPEGQEFFITFTMDEGKRYQFGDVRLESSVEGVDLEPFRREILIDSGSWFNPEIVDEMAQKFTEIFRRNNLPTLDVRSRLDLDKEKGLAHVVFEFFPKTPVYANRVSISGNTVTQDHVIRREILVQEGSPFYLADAKQSLKNINRLGLFENVSLTEEATTSSPTTHRNMTFQVVEKPSTGSVVFGAGYSTTDGFLLDLRYLEKNFLGSGYTTRGDLFVSKRTKDVSVGLSNPCLLTYSGLSGGVDFYTVRTQQDTKGTWSGGYQRSHIGSAFQMGYRLTDDLSQSFSYRLFREDVTGVSSCASPFLKKVEGTFLNSSIGQVLTYDRRNSFVFPTEGYNLSLRTELAGVGGSVRFLKNFVNAGFYYPLDIDHDWVINARAQFGLATEVGRKVRLSDRLLLGGVSFRGFGEAGIGPRDTKTQDALGGHYLYRGTLELAFPLGFPREVGLKALVFTDWGSVWSSKEETQRWRISSDEHFLRGSVGAGLQWYAPFGMLRLSWSKPLRNIEGVDVSELFQIQIGTDL